MFDLENYESSIITSSSLGYGFSGHGLILVDIQACRKNSLTTTSRSIALSTTKQTTAKTTAPSAFQKAVLMLKASETEKLSMIIGFDGKR